MAFKGFSWLFADSALAFLGFPKPRTLAFLGFCRRPPWLLLAFARRRRDHDPRPMARQCDADEAQGGAPRTVPGAPGGPEEKIENKIATLSRCRRSGSWVSLKIHFEDSHRNSRRGHGLVWDRAGCHVDRIFGQPTAGTLQTDPLPRSVSALRSRPRARRMRVACRRPPAAASLPISARLGIDGPKTARRAGLDRRG